MGRPKGTKNNTIHKWTKDEKAYLGEITPGHHYREIQELMNKKFNIEFRLEQIKAAINRNKFNTGFTGQFDKGSIPVNKGKKGIWFAGSEKSWFKEGHTPINHREVGSERITVDGYTEVKVQEPNKWSLKHRLTWIKNNGPIPKGHAVIFGDGDRQNIDINNLILVSRAQLVTMNKNKLIQNNADLTRTGVILADLYQGMSKLKNSNKG